MGRLSAPGLPALAAFPAIGLAAFWLTLVVLSWMGHDLWWGAERLNLAEAAVLRDSGEAARLLDIGADPAARYLIREGILGSRPAEWMTPARAAVRADRPEILQLLIDAGLVFDDFEWHQAWCVATGDDIRRMLQSVRPQTAGAVCATEPPVEHGAPERDGTLAHPARR